METVADGNSAAASTGAESTPATFAAAFASDASSTSESSQQPTTPPAAVQPAADAQAQPQQTDDARSPFIPRARFDEVNTKKAELESQLQALAWAKSVDRTQVEQAVRLSQLFQNDRAGFVRELIGDNPPPELVSEFARTLSSRRGATAAEEPKPDLPIQLEDGRVVHLYSAEQQAKREAWLQQQWNAQIEQKIAPALQTTEQLRKAQEQYQLAQQAGQFASTFGADLQKLPHFEAVKGELRERLAKVELPADAPPAAVEAAALRLYTQILSEKVLPTLTNQAESRLLDNLQQKAAASTSVNPGSAAPSTARTYKSFNDLPADMWK